ncbi:hypothetical protein RHGRI_021136 [Rhododendron griersonianum]|uniref:LOB domain-containing protein n=1 Tax=Rhododendron griersonianum TaxID=479676 RepID=A0AAV6JJ10_9ERIC|nr:hypothetical protein RHGRI_021136 [Rhododendron griersonianum]
MIRFHLEPPRSTSSGTACKFLKPRCSPTSCLFAPYFRSDEPEKFAKVHEVFGASNVAKILVDVPENQRDDAVNSLVYEVEAQLRDPVYDCIGAIALLQRKAVELPQDLAVARSWLTRCSALAGGGMTSSLSTSSLSVLSDEVGVATVKTLPFLVFAIRSWLHRNGCFAVRYSVWV